MEAPPRPLLLGSWAATSSEALGSVCGCGGVGGGAHTLPHSCPGSCRCKPRAWPAPVKAGQIRSFK